MSRTVKTVRVVIHVSDTGTTAIGILTSEHRGAVRLDRRWRSARPGDDRLGGAPRGVDPVIWLAYAALARMVDESEAAGGDPHP